jgi:hypothetical protein
MYIGGGYRICRIDVEDIWQNTQRIRLRNKEGAKVENYTLIEVGIRHSIDIFKGNGDT